MGSGRIAESNVRDDNFAGSVMQPRSPALNLIVALHRKTMTERRTVSKTFYGLRLASRVAINLQFSIKS